MSVGKKTSTKSIEEIRFEKLEQRVAVLERYIQDLFDGRARLQEYIPIEKDAMEGRR